MAEARLLPGLPWAGSVKRRRERHLLASGDRARDRRHWAAATAFYQQYLELRPDAFSIWVQYGHALKESGRLDDAWTAYQNALAIDRANADLYLQTGHLLKIMNRRREAAAAYQESVRLDGNLHAQSELARLGVLPAQPPAASDPATETRRPAPSKAVGETEARALATAWASDVDILLSPGLTTREREELVRRPPGAGPALHVQELDCGPQPETFGRWLADVDARVRESTATLVLLPLAGAVLEDGWLSGFLRAFAANPLAFAAVGLVVNGDGHVVLGGARLIEDAGVVPADTGKRADHFSVRACEELDALQPGLVALAPDLFRELGGFSLTQASLEEAFLELSARARAAGYTVVRAPGARQVLAGPAAHELALRLPSAAHPVTKALCAMRKRKLRALVVDGLTPTPDQDAGSQTTFGWMQVLKDCGYAITFVPMYDIGHAGRYTTQLEEAGIRCPVEDELGSAEAYVQRHGAEFDLIMLNRITVAYRLLHICRQFAPRAKNIFHTHDLHYLREERIAAQSGRPEDIAQAANTRVEELRCIREADATVLVSPFEVDVLRDVAPAAHTYVIGGMQPGVGRQGPRAGRDGVLFVGGFAHSPNTDAVKYLCEEIWPKVRRRLPSLKLFVAGPNPPEDICAFGSEARGVEILGFVPNLQPYYRRCILNVAPLRVGAGVKGKVMAAMLVGLPTVATPVATEGMGLQDGEDVLIGADADGIAQAIVRLVGDEALWNRISNAGIRLSARNFSIDAQAPQVRRLLQQLHLPA